MRRGTLLPGQISSCSVRSCWKKAASARSSSSLRPGEPSGTPLTAVNRAKAWCEGPVPVGDDEVLVRAFGEAEGLESKKDFRYPAKGKKGVQIDEVKPGRLISHTGRKLDSRGKTFEGLKQAAERSATFEGIVLTVGQGNKMIAVHVGEVEVEAGFIEALLTKVLEKF